MESITPLINQLDTFPILGQYLVNPAHRDPIASVLVLTRNSQISEVCGNLRDCNRLAMQKMWREQIALLERADPMPINRELRTADELLAHDRQERIKNGLKGRMLAVVPRGDATSLDEDVIGCYGRLFQKQREAVHGSAIQSKIDAFTVVQRRYGSSSFSFERFYENEAVIDDAELEMDQNLELAWPWVLMAVGRLLPNYLPLTAGEIEAWIDHPDNQEVWNGATGWLHLSRLNLTNFPKQVCRLTNLTGVDLSQNCLTNLPMEFNALINVTYLNLSSNQLSRVPPVICQLAQLRVLDLSHNRLSELPQELRGNVQLEVLNISHNRFTQVPSAIAALTSLHALDISNNQIQELPGFLANPYRMSLSYFLAFAEERFNLPWNLDVSGNPIRSIHCVLDNLEGVNMDFVEEIEISLQDWIVSRIALPRLDIVALWYWSARRIDTLGNIFAFPSRIIMRICSNFPFADRLELMLAILNMPLVFFVVGVWMFLFMPIAVLVGWLTNTIFWSINMFITGVIGPIVGLARELLGYRPTIRLR